MPFDFARPTRLAGPVQRCAGTLGRRAFLRTSLVGLSSWGLADLLRAQSAAATNGGTPGAAKSIIVLWLWGGPSHMDTFDLKPLAPSEFRGQFRPIATAAPGLEICEHLPRLAALGDRFSLIRSLHHDSPGHANSSHTLLTGYPGELVETPPYAPKHPDWFSVAQRVIGPPSERVAPFVAMPRVRYLGSAYLGPGFAPLVVAADPSAPEFKVPNLSVTTEQQTQIARRRGLAEQLDRFRSDLDQHGIGKALDGFQSRAAEILTSSAMQRAFDLNQEPGELRDRYGRHELGQRCLLARRLVEAGCPLVSIDFPCVPGQKAFSWDDHASVWNIFEEMQIRLPVLDQVVSALIEDLFARSLDRDVLLVVMGEMSHTPRLSNFKGQPGREHWGRAMSVLVSGGGLRMGEVVGATSPKGEEPSQRPVSPNDLLATWYRHLGVPLETSFPDFQGRPTPILPGGAPIAELF